MTDPQAPFTVPPAPRIRLFGPFTLESSQAGDAHSLPVKAQALLAFLAAMPDRWQLRSTLAALLWPALTPEAALGNLRQVLLSLRRGLQAAAPGVSALEADRTRVRLLEPPPGTIDLIDFLRLAALSEAGDTPQTLACMRQAVTLYRDDFMAQLHLDGCEEFNAWLQTEREYLRRQGLALLERVALGLEAAEQFDQALPFMERLVALDPLSEPAYAHTMRLLALKGQSSAALQMYEACVRVLGQELGVHPDARTRQLADQIERGALEREVRTTPPQGTRRPPSGRRPATVVALQFMFGPEQDAESLDEPLQALLSRGARLVAHHGGHAVRTPDGGLLGYFGYPRALEDAAWRGLRAALALASMQHAPVRTRVGVHSGWIVSDPQAALPDRVGLTSQVALRLSHLAEAGQVTASHDARRLAEGGFRWQLLGARPLPHRQVPQPTWIVVDQREHIVSRLQAQRRLTPLVGRTEELAALDQAWRQAQDGRGSAWWLHGEAGVGKSRLIHELSQRVLAGRGQVRELLCHEPTQHVPLRPLAPLVLGPRSRAADLDLEGESGEFAAYLHARWPQVTPQRFTALLATFGHEHPAGHDESDAPSPLSRGEAFEILSTITSALSREKPLLLVVEDLHWSDPSTVDWLTQFSRDLQGQPLLLLMSARPGFQPPWTGHQVRKLDVPPLSDQAQATLVGHLRAGLPEHVVTGIVRRAGGVPLFAEELARSERRKPADPAASIPATLQDLLASRLDRMDEALPVMQVAAALGFHFDMTRLAQVLQQPEERLAPLLTRLLREGYLTGSPTRGLAFRHALFQEAARQSQTRQDRQDVHRRVAQALSDPGLRTPVALLAQHWTAAELPGPAVDAWLRASEQAQRHGAHQEALKHLSQAAPLIPALEPPAQRWAAEYACRLGEGTAHSLLSGHGARDGVHAFRQALALADAHPGQLDPFPALCGLWFGSASRAPRTETRALVDRLWRLAEGSGDPVRRQFAHYALGNLHLRMGEFVAARAQFEAATARYEPAHARRMLREFGLNVQVANLCGLSHVCCITAEPGPARESMEHALQIAAETAHPYTLGLARFFEAVNARTLREVPRTLALAEAGIALARQYGYAFGETGARLLRGWALAHLGQAEGIQAMFSALGAAGSQMSSAAWVFVEALADALISLGRDDDALSAIGEGDVLAGHLEDHQVEAELLRLQGDCLLRRAAPDRAAGETLLWRAAALAQHQGARLYLLRAAVSLVRHGAGPAPAGQGLEGLPAEPRTLLDQVLGGLPEMADTLDGRQARACLDAPPPPRFLQGSHRTSARLPRVDCSHKTRA